MSEVWLDPELAHAMAKGCRTAADTAEGVRTDVLTAMTLSELVDIDGPRLLAELADELTALGNLLDLRAQLMEYADVPSNEGWLAELYRQADAVDASLTASLDDDDGAQRVDAAPFTLAGGVQAGDRATWFDAITLPGCEAFPEGSFYGGGGFVTGPDGRRYPIVVPHLEIDGHVYSADSDQGPDSWSVATLGGADPGWTIVAHRAGVERIVRAPSGVDQGLAFWAGTTGLVHPLPGNDLLPGISVAPDRRPGFSFGSGAPTHVDQPLYEPEVPLVPVTLFVNGRIQQVRADELDSMPRDVRRAAARIGVPPPPRSGTLVTSAVDLAVPVAQGLALSFALDNQSLRTYQVVFEEHVDGRTRARIESFSLTSGDDGTIVIQPKHLFVDDDGDLAEQHIEYAPYTTDHLSGTDYVIAQGMELPNVYKVPDAALPE